MKKFVTFIVTLLLALTVMTGSGSGITVVAEDRCDIGLSGCNLKEEEKAQGLTETILALDGIAVIVNPDNPVNDLDLETIGKIYMGEITNYPYKYLRYGWSNRYWSAYWLYDSGLSDQDCTAKDKNCY